MRSCGKSRGGDGHCVGIGVGLEVGQGRGTPLPCPPSPSLSRTPRAILPPLGVRPAALAERGAGGGARGGGGSRSGAGRGASFRPLAAAGRAARAAGRTEAAGRGRAEAITKYPEISRSRICWLPPCLGDRDPTSFYTSVCTSLLSVPRVN